MSANEHDDDQPDSFEVIERLRARVAKLEAALTALVHRLDEIAIHPDFRAMHTLAFTHGLTYGGPNWVGPLEIARAALKDDPQ